MVFDLSELFSKSLGLASLTDWELSQEFSRESHLADALGFNFPSTPMPSGQHPEELWEFWSSGSSQALWVVVTLPAPQKEGWKGRSVGNQI